LITNPQHSCNSYYTVGHYQAFKKTTPVATLSYIQATADTSANTDAGDKYTGLDRFERVIDQVWRSVAGSGTIMDRYQYGYDRAGNRLFKNNLLDTALSELYGYDNLNQTTSFSRGVLSEANSDGMFDTVASSSRTQAWNLDALGNWANLTTNSTSQSRTHNAQNQVTGVGSTSLTYDSNGSMTADESGRVFVYDAWNRLVSVRNTANSPIVGYSYDALSRRIIENRSNSNTVDHLYYSTGWQVVEERRGGIADSNIRRQYFWSLDYVDALTARVDYASGAVSATYHAQYDDNWNITAIADATSGVLERYIYDPYGTATVLYANWTVRGGSPYGWNYLHQGGRLDVDSNLYHFRHRDYSATLGRWTQNDPLGYNAGDVNLYKYLGNKPVKGLDPSGLEESTQSSGWWPWNWFDGTIDDANTIINAGSTVDDNFNRNVGYRWDPFDPNAPIVTHAGIIYPGGKPLTKDTAKLCQTAAEYGAAAGGMYGPKFSPGAGGFVGGGGPGIPKRPGSPRHKPFPRVPTPRKIGDFTQEHRSILKGIWDGTVPRSRLPLKIREQMSEMFYDTAKNNLCGYAQSEFNRARGDYLLGIGSNPGRNADEYGIKHGIPKYRKGS
jgi:RHS repeat-associated protein